MYWLYATHPPEQYPRCRTHPIQYNKEADILRFIPSSFSNIPARFQKGLDRERSNFAAQNMPRSVIRDILYEANKVGNVQHLEIGNPIFSPRPTLLRRRQRPPTTEIPYTPNAGYPTYGRPLPPG